MPERTFENELEYESLIWNKMQKFNELIKFAGFDFKQHQYDGVEWCLRNETKNKIMGSDNETNNDIENNEIVGGIIADEMGLGKTIMVIGLMFVNFFKHSLIVVPPILINQWETEIYRISGHKSLVYHGANKKKISEEDISKRPIIITTYSSIDDKIRNQPWNRIIFDEAHHLRNINKTSSTCTKLSSYSKWLVTGTPIQNTKRDLYRLCNILNLSANEDNIEDIVSKYVLRRTKEQVGIKLPPVERHECETEWKCKGEKELAEAFHSLLPNQTNITPEKANTELAIKISLKGTHVLNAIQKARQVCILPKMVKDKSDVLKDIDMTNYTSKMDALIKLIVSRKDNGRGKVIFCHFREEIDTIVNKLKEGGLTKVVKYDGRNSSPQMLSTLADPADALVIQIQSGNEGLNIQKNFSEVYFVSPHWNPSIEDQAIARCHRIGQEKPVDVFRFGMKDFEKEKEEEPGEITMDTHIFKVQEKKREIVRELFE
jgi:SNF2 family DNA or RNA helicase